MHTFTLLFITMLALSLMTRSWLAWRQFSHIKLHRPAVPEAFSKRVSLEEHQKAADYTSARLCFGRWPMIYDSAWLLVWTLGGGLEWLNGLTSAYGLSELVTGILVIIGFSLISSLLDLPFSLYSTFVLEEKFGFNKTTPKTFVADLFKGAAIMIVLGAPLIFTILWLMDRAGELWWLYAWMVWTGFSLFIAWAWPTWIAPIFNKFEPLEEGEKLERITQLLQRCGFTSNGIFVIDGSRRSSHGNAYFSGFGRNKRIVFFDTLLNMLDVNELEAVLAHELGHFKRKHILKGMLLSAATSLAGLWVLAWLMLQPWFYTSLGVSTASNAMALLLFALVLPAFTFLLTPLMSLFSRKNEFEADEFAAEQTNANDLIRALVGMYRENASTLTPDPLYSAFYDSHPPAPVRIAHLASHAMK